LFLFLRFLCFFFFYLQALNFMLHAGVKNFMGWHIGLGFIWNFKDFFDCSFDLFGLVFLLLAYLVGVVSFLTIDTKLFAGNIKYIFVCNVIVLVVAFFVVANDILVFFFIIRVFIGAFIFFCLFCWVL